MKPVGNRNAQRDSQSNEKVQAQKKNTKALKRYRPTKGTSPSPATNVTIGKIVLCKMRGYPEWPATIKTINNKKVHVQFFGDNTTTFVHLNNIFSFENSIQTMVHYLNVQVRPLYRKAVVEAEIAAGIPSHMSIVNNC